MVPGVPLCTTMIDQEIIFSANGQAQNCWEELFASTKNYFQTILSTEVAKGGVIEPRPGKCNLSNLLSVMQ